MDGTRRGVPAAELAIGALAAAVMTVLVHAVIAWMDFDALSTTAPGLGPVWAALMIAVGLLGYLVQARSPDRSRWVIAALAGAAVGLALAPLMAGLHGTPQPPFTVLRGDMTFRTEYITRFASTWRLRDYTFAGLHAFYPPAWFWLAGRTAHYLGVEPWRIVKPFTLGTVGAALALAYVLWRRVLTPAGALAAAIGSSLVLTRQMGELGVAAHATQGWYSPYSCFVAVTGVAWLAATLSAVRDGDSWRGWLLLVLVGALLALCYYLLFVILVVVLLVLALAARGARLRSLARSAGVLALVALLTAVFWVPLVVSVANGAASQGHYLAPDFLEVQVGFNGPAELIVLTLAVVVALVLGSGWSAPRAVAGLLVGTVLYQLISVTSLVFSDNQLQPHRAATMMWATLGAAVPVALEGFRRGGSLGVQLPVAATRAVATVVAIVAVGATFVAGALQGRDLASGSLTIGAHDPTDMAAPGLMSRFITSTTGRPAHDLVLLTGEKSVLITRPYSGFLALSARYAHPEAQQPARVKLIERIADCPTAGCTTRLLTHNRFGAVDAMILTNVRVGYQLNTQVDGFPLPRIVTIDFPRAHLDPRVWAVHRFGLFTAFARRPHPLAHAPGPAALPARAPGMAPVVPRHCAPGKRLRRGRSGRLRCRPRR